MRTDKQQAIAAGAAVETAQGGQIGGTGIAQGGAVVAIAQLHQAAEQAAGEVEAVVARALAQHAALAVDTRTRNG
ncbi:hypothetical protein [Pseudomonas jinjuensis]|uniref:hypothetical protein n=1 Tax=Pseudomonas jinjuensis TaxID=198616 RepID=UPI00146FB29B|nr:hypothetical protein [Pseudomonas jinjuensis]